MANRALIESDQKSFVEELKSTIAKIEEDQAKSIDAFSGITSKMPRIPVIKQ